MSHIRPVAPEKPTITGEYIGCSGSTPLYALNWSVNGPYTSFHVKYLKGYSGSWKTLHQGTKTGYVYHGANNTRNKIKVKAINGSISGQYAEITLPIRNCAGAPPPVF